MRKGASLLLFITLLELFSLFSAKNTSALIPCDAINGVPCTYCYPVDDMNPDLGCRVDYEMSKNCSLYGLNWDPDVCGPPMTHPCNAGQPSGNCTDEVKCVDLGQTCSPPGGPANCCEGICDQKPGGHTGEYVCQIPESCGNIGDPCPDGPPGSRDNCCQDPVKLVCDYELHSYNLVCQEPPEQPIGYWCYQAGQPCNTCYAGDTNAECVPLPDFTTPEACWDFCQGHTTLTFSCIDRSCVPDENGPFLGPGDCADSCFRDQRFSCEGGKCVPKDDGPFENYENCNTVCLEVRSPDVCQGGKGLMTAIGCIVVFDEQFTALASFFLRWGMGIAGGVAFVLIVYAGFLIATSSGNPQRLNAGKELMTAALMGLVMVVFSAFILSFVGKDLLGLNLIGF